MTQLLQGSHSFTHLWTKLCIQGGEVFKQFVFPKAPNTTFLPQNMQEILSPLLPESTETLWTTPYLSISLTERYSRAGYYNLCHQSKSK